MNVKQGLISALLATALLAPGLTHAQTKPPPSAQKLALARSIIQASGGEEEMRKKITAMFAASNTLTKQNVRPTTWPLVMQVKADVQSSYLQLLPQVVAIAERAYADNLTEREMSDYVAWLDSPSGRSVRAKSTAISTEIILAQSPLLHQMMPQIIQRAIDRTCQQSQCSDEDKRVIAAAMSNSMQRGG